MKILIVDDEKALLKALKRLLEEHDHDVECVDNAKRAVEMVKESTYDVILVDYRMPENDGMWFMDNAEIPSTTKVLLITAYVNRKVINRMFELGAAGYLIKPFSEEDLLRHLDFYVNPS